MNREKSRHVVMHCTHLEAEPKANLVFRYLLSNIHCKLLQCDHRKKIHSYFFQFLIENILTCEISYLNSTL